MATPLEIIKAGILAGDINMVISGYNRITGENLSVAPAPPHPEVQQAPRQFGQPPQQPYQQPEYYDDNRQSQQEGEKTHTYARAEPFVPKKRINMFADERNEVLPDYSEADRQRDQAAKRKAKAQRPAPYTPVKINCDGCGSRFQVNPIFVVDGVYRCDRCSGKRR